MCNFHLCVYDELHACLIKATFDTKESPEIFGWTSKDFRGSLISSLTPKCQRILQHCKLFMRSQAKEDSTKRCFTPKQCFSAGCFLANWSYLTVANRVFQVIKRHRAALDFDTQEGRIRDFLDCFLLLSRSFNRVQAPFCFLPSKSFLSSQQYLEFLGSVQAIAFVEHH